MSDGRDVGYTNWGPSQPNHLGGAQDYLNFYGNNRLKSSRWNDHYNDDGGKGYIIERDNPIPEPGALLLLTAGIAGILILRAIGRDGGIRRAAQAPRLRDISIWRATITRAPANKAGARPFAAPGGRGGRKVEEATQQAVHREVGPMAGWLRRFPGRPGARGPRLHPTSG